MERNLEIEVAESLETERALLQVMPELLADLDALGSQPKAMASLIGKHARPGSGFRVLDLGCGKGATAHELAQRFHCAVVGVDAFPPFIAAAAAGAARLGLADHCDFRCGDLRDALHADRYDAVIMAGLGLLLGDWGRTVGRLRQAVAPGGLMLIEDCFRRDDALVDYPDHRDALSGLTAHGDELLEEAILPLAELRAINRANNRAIQARAQRLAVDPKTAAKVQAYCRRQEAECRILEESYTCATWVLRRG